MVDFQSQTRIQAQIQEIQAACKFVQAAASQAGLTGKSLHHCQLVVDEACTNIVEHAYGGGSADKVIDLICTAAAGLFSIEIVDDGPPFDPLKQAFPDRTTALDRREPGGWGVHFIRTLMDEVHYERLDGRNHLTMAVRLPAAVAGREMIESDNQLRVTEITQTLKIINVAGRIDAAASDRLKQAMMANLNDHGTYLLLDLTDVEYISSSGLKMLVAVWKRARDSKGDLVLTEMQPEVLEMLKIFGFDLVFTMFDTLGNAKTHYSQGPTAGSSRR